jgi:hypothetical protein
MTDTLYTVPQAAEILDLTRKRVWALVRERRLGRRYGRDWLLTPAEVESLRDRPPRGRRWPAKGDHAGSDRDT